MIFFILFLLFHLPAAGHCQDKSTDTLNYNNLAEQHLSEGRLDKARENTNLAIRQGLDTARAFAIRGFIEFVDYDSDKSIEYFNKALRDNPSLGLAYIGKGLALIREGKLLEGIDEFKKAIEAQPDNALYKSYLGKAYAEAGKHELAWKYYLQAQNIDSSLADSFFYSALLADKEHNPLLALSYLERAVEKNANQMPFRSSLLLDSEKAVISFPLGNIYRKLGFSELARVEAIKSLTKNYANPSAHYLLGSYFDDTHVNPRSKSAEYVIARLLTAPNFNSNNLNVNTELFRNDYTTLFDSVNKRYAAKVDLQTQADRIGGLAKFTYSKKHYGYSFGYNGYASDGFRDNDKDDLHQFFTQGQYQLNENTSSAWDTITTLNQKGDTSINVDPYRENEELDLDIKNYVGRLGIHNRVSKKLHLLANFLYNAEKINSQNRMADSRINFISTGNNSLPQLPGSTTLEEDVDIVAHQLHSDIQTIYDNEIVTAVFGYSNSVKIHEGTENSRIISQDAVTPLEMFNTNIAGTIIESNADTEQFTNRTFLYSTWHIADDIDIDLGLTYSKLRIQDTSNTPPFHEGTFTTDSLSPKAGFNLELSENMILRAAYSKTLGRTSKIGVGPLEPTYVGGFNQVYEGPEGRKQKLYAIGIDYKLPESNFYLGGSFIKRFVKNNNPFLERGILYNTLNGETQVQLFDSEQDTSRTISNSNLYCYHSYNELLASAFKLDWQNEKNSPFEYDTIRAGGKFSIFAPSMNLFAYIHPVYRTQTVKSSSIAGKTSRDFIIVDAGIGYEFDNRNGYLEIELLNLFDESFTYNRIADEAEILPDFGLKLIVAYNF